MRAVSMLAAPVLLALLSGCVSGPDRVFVSGELSRRAGHGLSAARAPGSSEPPAGVVLEDGVDEDEAVATALWNNAALQAELARIGMARADLVEAVSLPNPIVQVLAPVGAKPFELSILWAIDWIWQLPNRQRAARSELERVAHSLVQTGLDVARDARIAHADSVLADARDGIATRTVEMWQQSAQLFAERAQAGDISELEAWSVRGDLAAAREAEARARQEALLARARLSFILGIERAVPAVPGPIPIDGPGDLGPLVARALAERPDVRSSKLALDAGVARVGWERAKTLSVSAIVNAKGVGQQGILSGPGAQVTLPILNQNQGPIGRARADVERLAWTAASLRQRVTLDVQEAHAQLERARATLGSWRAEVVAARQASLTVARSTWESGQESFLVVVDATRRLDEARLREAELEAEVRRSTAQLERAIGGRLDVPARR